jgi:hypothetical protein
VRVARQAAAPCVPACSPSTQRIEPEHSASGGLSTVITPLGSADANRKLCQLELIERTAAL